MATHTATHPNAKLSQEEALRQLYAHPQFPKGGRVVAVEKTASGWVAKFETKTAEFPPPKGDNDDAEAPPKPAGPDSDDDDAAPSKDDDSKPSDSEDSPLGDELEGEEPKKPSVEEAVAQLTSLVTQIAEAVGVSPHGGHEGPPAGPEGPLGPHGGPHPPAGPPAGGPPAGPPGAGGGKAPARPPLRPGMAPPGTTPVGAPSFASVNDGLPKEAHLTEDEAKIASSAADFVVSAAVEKDDTIADCQRAVEAKWGPHGFTVKRMVEGTDDEGNRVVRARISRR